MAPRIVELSNLGLSPREIMRLILSAGCNFRSSSFCRNVDFWRQAFGSFDELLRVLKVSNGLLGVDLEKVIKPNLAFLQGCGISVSEIPNAFVSRMVAVNTKHLQEALARVDEFGIDRDSLVFPHALAAFSIFNQQKLNKTMQLFEKLGWSKDNIARAVRRLPNILGKFEEKVRRKLEFLTGDIGLETIHSTETSIDVI